jgi:mono/diheme cytochrome c family protein
MKVHFPLFFAITCIGALANGQTVTDSSAPAAAPKPAKLQGDFQVAGQTGTSAASRQNANIPRKPPVADTRPLPAPSKKADVTYVQDIRPIFREHCFACHGEQNQFAGLRLDTLQDTLKGTKAGPVIVPGKSRQSSLVIAVAQLDDETAMPPPLSSGKSNRLSSKEIGLIRAWIIQGAR